MRFLTEYITFIYVSIEHNDVYSINLLQALEVTVQNKYIISLEKEQIYTHFDLQKNNSADVFPVTVVTMTINV